MTLLVDSDDDKSAQQGRKSRPRGWCFAVGCGLDYGRI